MTHQPNIVERQKDHCKILTRVQTMTTITGPGVEGELTDIRMQVYTHTITRKDATCSQQPSQPRSPGESSASSPESGSWSITNAAPAALRPASEVAREMTMCRASVNVADLIRQRDREVVRAFAEWCKKKSHWNLHPDTINDFIRTRIGGEQ